MIYDYVDLRVPMLDRMYHKRLPGYAAIGYTVRGDREGHGAENRIFSQEEYWPVFSEDICNAQKEILVISPYLHIAQVKRFLNLIPENIRVTIVTSDRSSFKPEAWEKASKAATLLKENGVTVLLQPKVYQRYAVIDQNILWYGGINFLGFDKAEGGTIRLCSPELAEELLDRSCAGQETQMKLTEV